MPSQTINLDLQDTAWSFADGASYDLIEGAMYLPGCSNYPAEGRATLLTNFASLLSIPSNSVIDGIQTVIEFGGLEDFFHGCGGASGGSCGGFFACSDVDNSQTLQSSTIFVNGTEQHTPIRPPINYDTIDLNLNHCDWQFPANDTTQFILALGRGTPADQYDLYIKTVTITVYYNSCGEPTPPPPPPNGGTLITTFAFAVGDRLKKMLEIQGQYCTVVSPPIYLRLTGSSLPLGYQFFRDFDADWLFFQPGFCKTAASSGTELNTSLGIRIFSGKHGQVSGANSPQQEGLIVSPYTELQTPSPEMSNTMFLPALIPWQKRCVFLVEIHGINATLSAGGTDTIEFSIVPYVIQPK